MLEEVQKEKVD